MDFTFDSQFLPNESEEVPEEPRPSAPPEPTPYDEDFIDAQIHVESRGNPRAVSHAGAKGLMQIMDDTGRELAAKEGVDYDPFNPEQNRKLGTRYSREQFDEFGDARLSLAAYNWGPGNVKRAQKEYGKDYEDIAAYMPTETRNYVRDVLDTYSARKDGKPTQPSKSSQPEDPLSEFNIEPHKGVYGNKELGELYTGILTNEKYDSLSFLDRMKILQKVVDSGKWDSETIPSFRQFADFAWQGANPDELPRIEDFVGKTPVVASDQNPDEVLENWKNETTAALHEKGISPLLFGSNLDRYFDEQIANEKSAFEYRNRSTLGSVGSAAGGITRDIIKGAAAPVTMAAAMVGRGVDRLVGNEPDKGYGEAVGTFLENALGRPVRDYEYEVDDQGYLKLGADGLPIHRVQGEIIQGIAQVASLIGTGTAALRFGIQGTKLMAGMGGMVTLDGMEGAYQETLAEGGSPQQGMEAALYAAGPSAISTLGSYAVVVGAPPALLGLSTVNKVRVLSPYLVKNGVIEAAANVTQQAGQSASVSAVLDKNVQSVQKLGSAAAYGFAGGVIAKGVDTYLHPTQAQTQKPYDPKQTDSVAPPVLGLPAPPERLGLPAPPEQQLLPPGGPAPLELPGKTLRRGADPVIRVSQPVDVDARAELGARLERFQDSENSQLVLTQEQAGKLDPEVLRALHMDAVPDENGGVVIQKRETYVAREGQTLEDVESAISAVHDELLSMPTKDAVPELTQEVKDLRREVRQQEASYNRQMVELVKERTKLQHDFDNRKKVFEQQADPILRKVAKLEMNESEAKLRTFDDANEGAYEAWQRIEGTRKKLDTAVEQLKRATDPTRPYYNDLAARERNLQQLVRKRAELRRKMLDSETRAQEEATTQAQENLTAAGLDSSAPVNPDLGVNVEGFTVLPHDGKWYVLSPHGDIVGQGYQRFYDAVNEGVAAGKDLESLRYIPVQERTRLSRTDYDKIGKRVRDEQKVKAEQERESRRHYEALFKKEVKEGKSRTGKEDRARKRVLKKKGATGPVSWKGRPSSDVAADTDVLGGTPTTEALKEQVTLDADTNQEPLPRSESSDTRLVRRPVNPGRSLTSDYVTDSRRKFTGTGDVQTPARQVFENFQKFIKTLDRNLKVFRGGLVPENVRGFYHWGKNYIKVGRFDNVSTLVHEATHAADRYLIGKWDPATGAATGYADLPVEILNAARDTAITYYPGGDQMDPITQIKEGFAVFLQHYMTGQPVRKDMLDWWHSDFRAQNPEAYQTLEGLADQVFNYYNQKPELFTKSRIVPIAEEKRNIRKRDWSPRAILERWVDPALVLKEYDVAGNDGKTNPIFWAVKGNVHDVSDTLISRGIVDAQGFTVPGLALEQALAPAKGKADDLAGYLYAKRVAYSLDPQNIESGLNRKDALETIARIERDSPEVAKAAEDYYRWHLQTQALEGSLSRTSAFQVARRQRQNIELTGAAHGYYVPLPAAGHNMKWNPNAKLVGTTRDRLDPLYFMKSELERRLAKAYENQVKESIIDLSTKDGPSSAGLYVREVTDGVRIGELKKELKNQFVDSRPMEAADMAYFAESLPGNTPDTKVLAYSDGTKLRFFEVDSRIMNLFESPVSDLLNKPVYKYLVRIPTEIKRMGASTLNPYFAIRNPVRDTPNLIRYHLKDINNPKDAFALARAVMQSYFDEAMYAVGKKKRLAERLQNLGIHSATRVGAHKELRRTIEKQFGDSAFDLIDTTLTKLENLFSTPERATRQASWRFAAYKMGITDMNAPLTSMQLIDLINAYKEGTTNFQRQGYTARHVNTAVPFFTARINEIYRLKSDWERSPKKMAVVGTAMFLYGVQHALDHMDEQWYKELAAPFFMEDVWETVNVNGVDKAVRVPLDTFSGINFGMGQIIGRMLHGDPEYPEKLDENMKTYMARFSPINHWTDVTTPLLQAAISQYANQDFFSGRPIVPPYLKYKNPKDEYTEYTTSIAREVGELMNWSPLRVEKVMRDVFPAGVQYAQMFDTATGAVKAKPEDTSANTAAEQFMLRAFGRRGSALGITDRSADEFYENIKNFELNRDVENPAEKLTRLKLEKIKEQLSAINVFLYAVDDKETRNELYQKRRDLLRQGNRIAKGSAETVAGQPSLVQGAKKLRKQQRRERQTEATE